MRDNSMPNRDELDIVLDAALATYADPEPSPGLTARIHATTRAIDRHPRVRWMIWAVPALAALMAVVILFPARHIYRDPPPSALQLSHSARTPTVTTPYPVKTGPARGSPRSRASATIRAAIPAPGPLPRQEVFPTPTPLTPEEQALASLVNHSPEKLAQQIAQPAVQPEPIKPVRIAAIHVPPLNPPDIGGN